MTCAEDGAPKVRHDPFADPGDQIEAAVAGRRQNEDGGEQHQDRLIEEVRIARGKAFVDQLAQPEAEAQDRERGDRQRQQRTQDLLEDRAVRSAREIRVHEEFRLACALLASLVVSANDRRAHQPVAVPVPGQHAGYSMSCRGSPPGRARG